MQAVAMISPAGPHELPIPAGHSATANVLNTAILRSVTVRSAINSAIPYQLQTASGSTAFSNLGQSPSVTTVPEPGTWGFTMFALSAGIALRMRYTRRR
jgi:hypothetical protein